MDSPLSTTMSGTIRPVHRPQQLWRTTCQLSFEHRAKDVSIIKTILYFTRTTQFYPRHLRYQRFTPALKRSFLHIVTRPHFVPYFYELFTSYSPWSCPPRFENILLLWLPNRLFVRWASPFCASFILPNRPYQKGFLELLVLWCDFHARKVSVALKKGTKSVDIDL